MDWIFILMAQINLANISSQFLYDISASRVCALLIETDNEDNIDARFDLLLKPEPLHLKSKF